MHLPGQRTGIAQGRASQASMRCPSMQRCTLPRPSWAYPRTGAPSAAVTGSKHPAMAPPLRQAHRQARSARSVAAPAGGSGGYSAALIFDCDGVIVETEELHRLAYNGSFQAR
jgi:hypothetical protein